MPCPMSWVSVTVALVTVVAVPAVAATDAAITVGGGSCGRIYDGIGGLSNSCAPWLKA